jgi:hypothetical protein
MISEIDIIEDGVVIRKLLHITGNPGNSALFRISVCEIVMSPFKTGFVDTTGA